MKRAFLIVAILLVGCASHNDPYENMSGPGEFDRTFLGRAFESGATEIQLAQLAQQRADRNDILRFAREMLADHSRINDDLTQLARMKGVPLPDSPGHDGQLELSTLQAGSSTDFDRDYAKAMLVDHVRAVAEFTEAAEKARDKDIRRFASKTLPTLQEHLRMAREIQEK
jgi:putative membrane protein